MSLCLENLMPPKMQGFRSSYPIWMYFWRGKTSEKSPCASQVPHCPKIQRGSSNRDTPTWPHSHPSQSPTPLKDGKKSWENNSPQNVFFIVSFFWGGKIAKKKLLNFSTKTLESRNSSNVFPLLQRLPNNKPAPPLSRKLVFDNSSIARAAQMQNHPYLFGLKTNKISMWKNRVTYTLELSAEIHFNVFQIFEAWAARGWVKTAGIRKNRGLFAQDHRGCGFWSLKCELNACKRLQLAHPKIQFRIGHQFWKLLQHMQGKRKTQGKVGPTLFQKNVMKF